MKIQELEKELNISRANIRFYEKEGLLNPARKENGYRDYSDEDIAVLKKIIIYRKLGISVTDIKKIFANELDLQEAVSQSIENLKKE
ncbi:MAG: MerR family transcriptional regulator, partial [Eubacterium sp.]|nr:MerR family transcriptional regulator [Eubacterium sp.]